MKKSNWQLPLCIALLALSAVVYFIHFLIFRDAHHIFIYLLGDIGFVFAEVLLVTVIIHRLLEVREHKSRMEKLNMVIGAFYSEVGSRLLRTLAEQDPEISVIQRELEAEHETPDQQLHSVAKCLKDHRHRIDTEKLDWDSLKAFLMTRRDFLLRLLENPNLLEHESFTDVLWAVFHLTEELQARETLADLPKTDSRHLGGDAQRVYGNLSAQWLSYMEHLRDSYPYLFSLAMRTNPFDRTASPLVQ